MQVTIQLPNSKDEAVPHTFTNGEYRTQKDGLDVVALFDGTSFRLEQLAAAITGLKCVTTSP